jgi:hypothetical protein
VTFIGGTLWTDMNKEDPNTLFSIKSYMNDFRIIENSNEIVNYKVPVEYGKREDGTIDYEKVVRWEHHTRSGKFSPEIAVSEHKDMLQFINEVIGNKTSEKYVIVGHHAPSKRSTKPKYENDKLVNGAYSSDLSEFIMDRPQIKFWTHGHTHDPFDYTIGSTRIVCNPRGYINYEDSADDFELKYFEV